MAKFVNKVGGFIPVLGSLIDLGIFVGNAIKERRARKRAGKVEGINEQKAREAKARIDRIVEEYKRASKK